MAVGNQWIKKWYLTLEVNIESILKRKTCIKTEELKKASLSRLCRWVVLLQEKFAAPKQGSHYLSPLILSMTLNMMGFETNYIWAKNFDRKWTFWNLQMLDCSNIFEYWILCSSLTLALADRDCSVVAESQVSLTGWSSGIGGIRTKIIANRIAIFHH